MVKINNVESLLEEREEKDKKKQKRFSEGVRPVKKLTKKEQQIQEVAAQTVLPSHYCTVRTMDDLVDMERFLHDHAVVAVDTETMGVNPFTDEIVGVSLYAPKRAFYIPLKHKDERCLSKEIVASVLERLLVTEGKKIIGHNFKFDAHILYNWLGIDCVPYFDTMVAQSLLDENQSKKLKDMATLYLKIPADKYSDLFGKVSFDLVPMNLATYYAAKDAELTYMMYEFQSAAFERPGLEKIKNLFYEVEMPFIPIVIQAERRGVKLDIDYLEKEVSPQLHREVEELKQKIWKYTGEINLNSPAQLSVALYDRMKLPKVNDKSPRATDEKTLKKLKKHHEVADLLIKYRKAVKLATAFADKLPKMAVAGRVHTSFNTTGTVTGRLSSNQPNLCGAA